MSNAAAGAALTAGGNREQEAIELPTLDHPFQSARSGAVGERGAIVSWMAATAVEHVARCIAPRASCCYARSPDFDRTGWPTPSCMRAIMPRVGRST